MVQDHTTEVRVSLPKFQAIGQYVVPKDWSLLQTTWAALIDPIIGRQQNQSNILSSVSLVSGSNTVNHLLGRKLQGWKIVLQGAAASIYDTQATNQTPELTLILVSDNPVTVSLEVF